MRTSTTLRLWVLAVATIVVAIACDRVNLTAPTGSTISLSADRSVLPLGGETTVRAVVTESAGTPTHNGTVVTFQTNVGSFNPPSAPTVDGIASTTFLAGTSSGTALISAFSGGARTGGNGSGTGITIKIGAAAASGNISVSATPSSVSQSGGTVTISALVFDESSNPLPGVNVQFVASTGSLSATTATTDSNGIARTQLTTTQSATVTAIAGAAKGETRVEVSAAPPVQITVSPEPAIVGVPVAITVSSNGSPGARQIQSVTVDFGDGTSDTRFNVTGSAAFTHTYGRAGGYAITARVTDVAGNTGIGSRALTVQQVVPTVGITADDTTPDTNAPVTFTITAAPAAGGPPLASVRATLNGEVLYSGTGPGSFVRRFPQGTHVIRVTATDMGGNEGQTSITIVAGPP